MFYENFEEICAKRGISPSAVGVEIGLNKSTPSAWKKNGTIPKESELKAIADILECDVSDFFRPKGKVEYYFVDASSISGADQKFTELVHRFTENARDMENVAEILRVYGECTTPRLRNRFMTMLYRFEDEAVVNDEQEY